MIFPNDSKWNGGLASRGFAPALARSVTGASPREVLQAARS